MHRPARRSPATGRQARTLHRLLEYRPGLGFQRDAATPLECDVVIVDEASMIDVELFAALVRAIVPSRTRLVLIGDANQLPPVGPGRVFGDLVSWSRCPVVRLEVLHRAALESWVHLAGRDLLAGRMPSLAPRPDFAWVSVSDAAEILPTVRRIVERARAAERETQVLIPQRPGVAGITEANRMLQDTMNPPHGANDPTMFVNGIALRIGDRVIQTRNNYGLEVFNGEIGTITSITGLTMRVQHDGRELEYDADSADDLQLAYALTVHRTQGSEFPWVIVVCHSTHTFILSRPLLYTAITRAKRGVVLVGDERGLKRAVSNRNADKRNTSLTARVDGTIESIAT